MFKKTPSMYIKLVVAVSVFLLCNTLSSQDCIFKNAHAHNDYKQKHPLSDALLNKFASIEVDIFLIKNELIVSHTHPVFKKEKTLENLYLKPLLDSCNKNNGFVYKKCNESIILLIDFKTDGQETYKILKKYLEKYKSILSKFENGKVIVNAVTIVITGNKPYDALQKETTRYAFADQSLMSLDKSLDSSFCFMASTKYSNVLTWKGKGEIPTTEKEKLITLVNQAHQPGKKVRLWASPENIIVWKTLLDCGVDLINTDELKKLNSFLMKFKK